MQSVTKNVRTRRVFSISIILIFVASSVISPSAVAQTPVPETPTSIILLIGDGMGMNQIEYGRLIEYGDGNSSILSFPFQTTISTDNIDGVTTDSAASATSIATGIKTLNGRIGMNWIGTASPKNIIEIAKTHGYATGLVAKAYLTHATPAAFAAHQYNRGMHEKIAQDIANLEVDVLLGGGTETDKMGAQINPLVNKGYTYIQNKTALASTTKTPVLGLFAEGSMPMAIDYTENQSIPNLSEMSFKAIELLESTGKPFFLMIEGSFIDSAGHSNDKEALTHEMIEFEKTVKMVKALAESKPNYLVMVTADHETGGFNILDKSRLSSPLPQESDSFAILKEKRDKRASEIDIEWTTGGHTSSKTILAGMGPHAEMIKNAEHHISTFGIMRSVIDGETGYLCDVDPYLFYMNTTIYYVIIGVLSLVIIVFIMRKIILTVKAKKSSKSSGTTTTNNTNENIEN